MDGEGGLQQLDRRIGQAGGLQHIVDEPVAFQEANPGIDSDQERGPERQDYGQHEQCAPALRRARDGERYRIADQQAGKGRCRGDPKRIDEGFDVERIAEQKCIVVETGQNFAALHQRLIGWHTIA